MATLRSENGWLAPGGSFYPCALAGHSKVIREIIDSTEEEAFNTGWIRLEDGGWFTMYPERPVTFVQYGVLKDWHVVHEQTMPDWIYRV